MKFSVSLQRWNSSHKLSIEVEAQPVPQETTKNTNPRKGAQNRGKQTTLQLKSSRSGHCLQLRPRRPHGRGRAAMFPRPQWWAAFLQDDRRSSIEVARQPALVRAARTEMASQEFGSHFELIEPMRSRKDIHTSDQIFQSPQRRMMNPKAGREEKTRKMTRAKIINFPSLPVKRPCNLDSSAVFATANKRVKEPVQTSIWEGIHSTYTGHYPPGSDGHPPPWLYHHRRQT